MLDLSGIEIFDYHMHAPAPLTFEQYEITSPNSAIQTWKRQLLLYVAKNFGCEPTKKKVDDVLSKKYEDFSGYIRSVLDSEGISKVLLDELSTRDLVFPKDKFEWAFSVFFHPWRFTYLKEKGAENIDDALNILKKDCDEALKSGVKAFKNGMAYDRTLDIDPTVTHDEANKAFKRLLPKKFILMHDVLPPSAWRHLVGSRPIWKDAKDYEAEKIYQDYLIKEWIILAGKATIPFNIHTGGLYYPVDRGRVVFRAAGYDPRRVTASNLWSIADSEEMMKTNIVMLHASIPYFRYAASLAASFSNFYVDLSYIPFYPRLFKEAFRNIVEICPPTKILYGSDSMELIDEARWCASNAKKIVAEVLEELRKHYGWTEEDCRQTAEMFFNKNAKNILNL